MLITGPFEPSGWKLNGSTPPQKSLKNLFSFSVSGVMSQHTSKDSFGIDLVDREVAAVTAQLGFVLAFVMEEVNKIFQRLKWRKSTS